MSTIFVCLALKTKKFDKNPSYNTPKSLLWRLWDKFLSNFVVLRARYAEMVLILIRISWRRRILTLYGCWKYSKMKHLDLLYIKSLFFKQTFHYRYFLVKPGYSINLYIESNSVGPLLTLYGQIVVNTMFYVLCAMYYQLWSEPARACKSFLQLQRSCLPS